MSVLDDRRAIQRFLDEVAKTALTGREATPLASSGLPLHARTFLTSLHNLAFEAPQIIVGNLKSLAGKLAFISRRRRFASVTFWPAAMAFLALLGSAIITFEQKRWDRHWASAYPGVPSLRISLHAYEAEIDDEKLHQPFDIHLAGHFRSILTNATFWNRPETVSLFQEHMRERARRAAKTYPAVSAGELAKADAAIAPAIESLKQFERRQILWFTIGFFWGILSFVALVDIVGILIAGQPLLLRPFGITIITRRGPGASRLRLFWRALVAWLPLFVGAPALAILASSTTEQSRASGEALILYLLVVAVIWIAGTVWTVLSRIRGPQDLLAGTVIVPR